MGRRKALLGIDPVWDHVTITQKAAKSNGKPKVQCNHCNLAFSGGTTRIKDHFRGNSTDIRACPDVPQDLLNKLLAEQLHKDAADSQKRKLAEVDKVTSSSAQQGVPKKACYAPTSQRTVPACFQSDLKASADEAVARYAYATATPFHALTDTSFKEMLTAVAKVGPAYKPPNINQLREGLLDKEYNLLQHDIRSVFFSNLSQNGCTVVSDGWADTRRRPLINTLACNDKGAVFLKATNTEGETKVI